MGNKLRFEDHQLKIFVGNREIGPLKVTESTSSSDMAVDKKKYMGDVRPTIDSTDNGFKCEFTVEITDRSADPNVIFDEYRNAVNDRSPSDVRIVESWRSPDGGARRGYRYSGCAVNINQSARSGSPTQFRISLDAEAREAV